MEGFYRCLMLVAIVGFAKAQVFFTGETSGKGVSSVFAAGTVSRVHNFTTPFNFWTAYTVGAHDRVDAFAYYGNLTIFGRTQHYAGVGASIGILKRTRCGLDIAALTLFSMPLNRREDAATVFAAAAPVASRPVRIRGYDVTLYGGYLRTESLGRRANKLFSPPAGTHNGILGAVIPIHKSLSLVAEYDPGPEQQNMGLAVLYVFPRK